MTEEKQMSLLQKLQKCKVELQEKGIKKSNYNEYGKYKYFDLGDFLPYINELCEKYQISNIVHFEKDTALLTLTNMEKTEEPLEWSMPLVVTPLKNCSEMQNIGAAQNYARKYLYFTAFEISESDMLDGGAQQDDEKIQQNKKIDPIKISTVKTILKKTRTNEKAFLQYFKLKKVEDITNGLFPKVMNALQRKEDEIQKNQAKLEKVKQGKDIQAGTIPDLGI